MPVKRTIAKIKVTIKKLHDKGRPVFLEQVRELQTHLHSEPPVKRKKPRKKKKMKEVKEKVKHVKKKQSIKAYIKKKYKQAIPKQFKIQNSRFKID